MLPVALALAGVETATALMQAGTLRSWRRRLATVLLLYLMPLKTANPPTVTLPFIPRLTSESCYIHSNSIDIPMTSKAEWHQPAVGRVFVTQELQEHGGAWVARGG